MRYFDNGAFYTVTFSERDSYEFARRWPCSTVRGRGAFQFDKRSGDLVDATGSAARGDGPDWLALSEDCQAYARRRQAAL